MIFTVIKNPGTLGYILVIEVLKTKDLTFKNSRERFILPVKEIISPN